MFIGEHRIKGSRCPFHLIADRLQYTSLLGTCERSGLCALRIGHLEQCFLSHSSLPSSFAYSPLPAADWQEERPISSQALSASEESQPSVAETLRAPHGD